MGVWLSVDPMATKYINKTPFNFSGNNTLNTIDPNGMWEQDPDGNWIAQKGDTWWSLHKQTGIGWSETIQIAKDFSKRNDRNDWEMLKIGDKVSINSVDNTKNNNHYLQSVNKSNESIIIGFTTSIEKSNSKIYSTNYGDRLELTKTLQTTVGTEGKYLTIDNTFSSKGELLSKNLKVFTNVYSIDVENIGFGSSTRVPFTNYNLDRNISIKKGLSLGIKSQIGNSSSTGLSASYRPGGASVIIVGGVFVFVSSGGTSAILIPAL
jgi:hypothetical protein